MTDLHGFRLRGEERADEFDVDPSEKAAFAQVLW